MMNRTAGKSFADALKHDDVMISAPHDVTREVWRRTRRDSWEVPRTFPQMRSYRAVAWSSVSSRSPLAIGCAASTLVPLSVITST